MTIRHRPISSVRSPGKLVQSPSSDARPGVQLGLESLAPADLCKIRNADKRNADGSSAHNWGRRWLRYVKARNVPLVLACSALCVVLLVNPWRIQVSSVSQRNHHSVRPYSDTIELKMQEKRPFLPWAYCLDEISIFLSNRLKTNTDDPTRNRRYRGEQTTLLQVDQAVNPMRPRDET